jgi:hypothetical protein
MTIEGALIREQGVNFAIVVVKSHVLNASAEAQRTIAALRPVFGGVPVILMAQDGRGRPTYYGRDDIVRFMARVPLGAVRWKRFTVS